MRLIGLRHGQSQYNLHGLCNDDPARQVDLTKEGVRQAHAAAQRDYQGRVGVFLDWLARQPWHCVLVVAHEETMRIIRAYCLSLGLADVVGQSFENCVPCVFQLADVE